MPPPGKPSHLKVGLLGGFTVAVAGVAIPSDRWPSLRARHLLQLLGLQSRHRMTREQVMDAVWPDLEPKAAAANLRKAIHHARQALGRHDAITPQGNELVLWPAGPIEVDADTFARRADAALRQRDAIECAEVAGSYAAGRDLYRYEDAVNITHVVEQADGQRVLLTDLQRMDASSEPAAVELQKNQARLPLLLHPAPGSVLFLGLGTGISAAGSLPYPALERTAVELSRGAIVAARTWFAPVNHGISEGMTVVRDDVRRFLRVSGRSYDVIIGDVFHPDLAGRSALLSVQQFELARARLNRGGVFVQWLALNQFDLESLRIVFRTFRHVFPGGVLFMDGFRIALVGFEGESVPTVRRSGVDPGADPADDPTGGEGFWTWQGRYWGRIPASEGPLQDEWRPVIEYRLPHARYRAEPELVGLLEWLLTRRPAVEQAAAELGTPAEDFTALERAYIATDLGLRSWVAALRGADTESIRLIRYAYQANTRDRWVSYSLADDMYESLSQSSLAGDEQRRALITILAVRPDHSEALRALWRLERDAGDPSAAGSYLARLRAVSPLDREVVTQAGE